MDRWFGLMVYGA